MKVKFVLENGVPLKGLMIKPECDLFLTNSDKGGAYLFDVSEPDSDLKIQMLNKPEQVVFIEKDETVSLVFEEVNIFFSGAPEHTLDNLKKYQEIHFFFSYPKEHKQIQFSYNWKEDRLGMFVDKI